jgi:hypothetical protein
MLGLSYQASFCASFSGASSSEADPGRRLARCGKQSLSEIWCAHVQGYTVPAKYSQVTQYLDRMQQRDSWKSTYYAPEVVVAGWKKH